jgi:phage gp46-like protein
MLRLTWDNTVGAARLVKTDEGALDTGGNIETAVLLSLFTDAEATPQEIAGAGLDEQRGWWADADSVRPAGVGRMGSKLWLLSREKTTLATLWLKQAGIAESISVLASRPRPGWLGFEISIVRPNKLLPKFERFWEMPSNAV